MWTIAPRRIGGTRKFPRETLPNVLLAGKNMRNKRLSARILVLPTAIISAHAQTLSSAIPPVLESAPTAQPTAIETQVTPPANWLVWGGDFRFRDEYFDNAISLTGDGTPLDGSMTFYRAEMAVNF